THTHTNTHTHTHTTHAHTHTQTHTHISHTHIHTNNSQNEHGSLANSSCMAFKPASPPTHTHTHTHTHRLTSYLVSWMWTSPPGGLCQPAGSWKDCMNTPHKSDLIRRQAKAI